MSKEEKDNKPKEFTDVAVPTELKQEVKESDTVEGLSSEVEKRYIEIIKDNAKKDEFLINNVVWKRRKISHREYKEIVALRKELNKINKIKDPELFESKHEEVYKKFAFYGLIKKETSVQMSEDDYDQSEAGEIERIIDGINYRITYGLPSAR
jgi:hypothetical protein